MKRIQVLSMKPIALILLSVPFFCCSAFAQKPNQSVNLMQTQGAVEAEVMESAKSIVDGSLLKGQGR